MKNSLGSQSTILASIQKHKFFFPGVVLALLVIPFTVFLANNSDKNNLFTQAANTTYVAGITTVGGSMDTGNSDGISSTKVTTGPNTGVLSSVSVYVRSVQGAPRNHMQVGIYTNTSNNTPGSLLTTSGSQVLKANSWNSFAMPVTPIASTTSYWLAFNVDGKNTQYAIASTNAKNAAWRIPTTFGTWPSPFGTPTQSYNEQYSIYMTYSGTTSQLPTPLPTATPLPTQVPPTAMPTSIVVTPTTVVPTSVPGTSNCPLPRYPNAGCTGVPSGTQLTTYNGDITANTAGQVINNMHITGDILVAADNIVIKNSQIDGLVSNSHSGSVMHPFTITDSTVGPVNGCISETAIGSAGYTATRVYVRNHGDGFGDGGNNILIQDSYVHLCSSNPDDHSDGIQGYLGGTNVRIIHNTIDQRDVLPAAQTAPVFISDQSKDADVEDNLFAGGSETIRVYYFGGKDIVKNNRVVNNSWIYGPVSSDCSNITWSGNTLVTIDGNYNITSTVGPLACSE